MHFEVLTEDRSGGVVVDALMRQILEEILPSFSISIRPHRGKGDIPEDPFARPERFASGLMDLLPAKLRAYDRVYAGTECILVVVMDSDNLSWDIVQSMLRGQCSRFAPGLLHVIGVCVEETESWLLADEQALLQAYPDADISVIREYKQDSVCGTWEVLCRALIRGQAENLIRVGYPAIGQYKHEWACNISKYLDPKRNVSKSFRSFCHELEKVSRRYANEVIRL